jgi:hypothetical protein
MQKLMKNNNEITININPSNYKKKFNNNKILGPNEINSGYTNINSPPTPGIIYIYRKEELNRVLIHELLHSLHFDYNLYNLNNNDIYKIYNLHDKQNINSSEAFVDKYAIIINCIYNSLKYDYEIFQQMLNYEKEFNKIQISKILKFYNYNSISDIYRNSKKHSFKQNTNVFSYFFLKFNDFNNIDEKLNKKYTLSLRLSLLEFNN